MRVRFHVSASRLARGRYRPVTDPQAAMERWWAELARVLHQGGVRPGGTGGDERPTARRGPGGQA
jgi:hypothetical protein